MTESDFSGPLGRKLDHVPTMSFVTGIQADILATSDLRWGTSAPAGGVHRMALAPPRMPVLHFAPGIHHYAHFCGSWDHARSIRTAIWGREQPQMRWSHVGIRFAWVGSARHCGAQKSVSDAPGPITPTQSGFRHGTPPSKVVPDPKLPCGSNGRGPKTHKNVRSGEFRARSAGGVRHTCRYCTLRAEFTTTNFFVGLKTTPIRSARRFWVGQLLGWGEGGSSAAALSGTSPRAGVLCWRRRHPGIQQPADMHSDSAASEARTHPEAQAAMDRYIAPRASNGSARGRTVPGTWRNKPARPQQPQAPRVLPAAAAAGASAAAGGSQKCACGMWTSQ